ncbi:D-2-hydroxyglutarate dehydrogenase, mitochondrial-like [Amphibalanus amphitrite]|uniref:D-2-hydroxyglutarate dehydrogenase, mitochondrial-like n=1 Tax=Amphibalanus amphitrite TaxID=1232801 RepID=UPI001C8FD5CC|nr:D-2-hydroxyglutarate dehydrogenase, mitochondrial-like [Amphibalanus amphitrite]
MRVPLTRCLLGSLRGQPGQARALFTLQDHSKKPSSVPLTKESFKQLRRGDFAEATPDDLSKLKELVKGRIETDKDDLLKHNCDWMRTLRGSSPCVVFPKTTEEVSAVLKYCSSRRLAVVPQGANTSLVGGSVPVFDEVIISTKELDDIIDIDADGGTLSCEAGCSLKTLEKKARKKHLFFPVDLYIREAQIGGVVAADMAGPRTARYGNLHGNVLGLEVVLPDGTVLNSMSNMRKDNTGFDLKQMFVGSEGSLGIITKVSMACPPRPKFINVAMVYTESFDHVLEIMRLAKEQLGEIMSACEFMDNDAVMSVKQKHLTMWGVPSKPYYVLIETAGHCDMHDEEKLKFLFNLLKDKDLIMDGQIGPLNYDDPTFVERLWNINGRILTALSSTGNVYHYDVSMPHSMQYPLVQKLRQEAGSDITKVASFGHLLDGNLHIALQSESFSADTLDRLDQLITENVTAAGGAVSAELGCGFKSRNLGAHCKDPVEMKLMRDVKKMLDPQGIMNPYKVFPDSQ